MYLQNCHLNVVKAKWRQITDTYMYKPYVIIITQSSKYLINILINLAKPKSRAPDYNKLPWFKPVIQMKIGNG